VEFWFVGITKSSELGHEVCADSTHTLCRQELCLCYLPWLLFSRKLMLDAGLQKPSAKDWTTGKFLCVREVTLSDPYLYKLLV